MPVLLINGTLNEHTFANSCLTAQIHSKKTAPDGLDAVLVAHSKKSIGELNNRRTGWKSEIEKRGLKPTLFQQIEVDLEGDPDSIVELGLHIERFISVLGPEERIYVDLTNGQSLQKAALGAVAYIVGAQWQFIVDTYRVDKSPFDAGYLSDEDLEACMVMSASPETFDSVGLAWYTEVRRFGKLANDATRAVERITDTSETVSSHLWNAELTQAIKNWLAGEKEKRGVLFGASIRHSGLAFEQLVRQVHTNLVLTQTSGQKTPTLNACIQDLARVKPDVFAADLVRELAEPLRDLRNASSHQFPDLRKGARRARSAIEMLLSFVDQLDTQFKNTPRPRPTETVNEIRGVEGMTYYFGLDGDNTGDALEELFYSDADATCMREFSARIVRAMDGLRIAAMSSPFHGEVVFCTGDDLLFRGTFNLAGLQKLAQTYRDETGMNCSVGYGSSLKEAFCALKLAKSRPSKGAIVGARIE